MRLAPQAATSIGLADLTRNHSRSSADIHSGRNSCSPAVTAQQVGLQALSRRFEEVRRTVAAANGFDRRVPSALTKTSLHQLATGSQATLFLVAVLGTSARAHAELIPRAGHRRLCLARRTLSVDIRVKHCRSRYHRHLAQNSYPESTYLQVNLLQSSARWLRSHPSKPPLTVAATISTTVLLQPSSLYTELD